MKKYFSGLRYSVLELLDQPQNLLQAHDGDGLDEALLAQAGAQQSLRQFLLPRSHFAQRQALALFGNEVPVEALVIFKFVGGLCPLLGRERIQKIGGRPGHQGDRIGSMISRCQQDDPYGKQ